ncbi:hypothetical protein JD844_021872 [Phrynosoma platyrhinos]|uniref:UEV domain-containing protein n=1 Tax=Phrynosoma platyrhinos TaxID=52577 RepID=A0ABQ7SUE2_PHRPL|nr:hypothetical protein JD844_021872 [Phrynosoma platyrhinos]
MAVTESQLKKMLGKYKYRDLTVQETISVIAQYKDLKPVMDGYVFNDGSSRELMSLTGTIPPMSDLIGLIQVMIVVFGEEPPVFSRPTISAAYPPYQATGPPNSSYMPGMPSGISFPPGPPPNPSGYPNYPYPPPSGPFPATTSTQHYPSQPPVTTVGE